MIQNFKARLIEKKKLTPDVLFLSFEVPKSFFFKAGQFVTMILKNYQVQKPKSYSILSPPSKIGKLDFCIKLIDNGFASEIFKKMSINDEITVKGPLGHFIFDEKTKNEHWFIGVGTGITPLYSMITEHLTKGKPMRLIFGEKTQKDLLFHDEFLRMKAKYDNFDYIPTISRGTWNGKMGRVQKYLPENLQNKTFYICGLKELVIETKELLLGKSVDSENIKFERYT